MNKKKPHHSFQITGVVATATVYFGTGTMPTMPKSESLRNMNLGMMWVCVCMRAHEKQAQTRTLWHRNQIKHVLCSHAMKHLNKNCEWNIILQIKKYVLRTFDFVLFFRFCYNLFADVLFVLVHLNILLSSTITFCKYSKKKNNINSQLTWN